ncbi:unnamed protein product [Effrenium voratum]|nr:unnamed protein product [Effrenium voratum]
MAGEDMTFEDLKEVCEGYICRKTDPFVSAHLPPGNFNHVTFPMTEMKSSDNAASHFLELHDYKEDINFADLSHAYKAAMDRNDLQMLPAPFGLKEKVGGDTMAKMGQMVLHRLRPKNTDARAPGPGAIRKVEWEPLAKKWLQDQQVVLHTDSAKSYKVKLPGVLHDSVIHCKKKIKVGGKWVWKAPTYVRSVTHKNPATKKIMKVKSGTQVIDWAWRFMKERIHINQNAKVGSGALRAMLRSAQYQYWMRECDLWATKAAEEAQRCQAEDAQA